MDSFLARFEQIILLEWPWDPPRTYRIVGVPPGCVQLVTCFLLDGGIGIISQGIFESSFSNALAYAEKNGFAELQKDAFRFRRFVGRCDDWPTEASLRANLSKCTYKAPRKDLSAPVHKIIKKTPEKCS